MYDVYTSQYTTAVVMILSTHGFDYIEVINRSMSPKYRTMMFLNYGFIITSRNIFTRSVIGIQQPHTKKSLKARNGNFYVSNPQ